VFIDTESENIPASIYFPQRAIRCSRHPEEYSAGLGMLNDVSTRFVRIDAKSGGVTSETNHGMSFGLGDVTQSPMTLAASGEEEETNALKYGTRDKRSISHKEICKY